LDAIAGGPAEAVRRFKDCLAEGRTSEIEDVFSFASAYQYMADLAASFGRGIPEKTSLRREIEDIFASAAVREGLASYSVEGMREKIMGRVASVVFTRAGATEGVGVASLVMENLRWKVRTYPGVFPGELLPRMRSTR
jgi:hypothetical protein